MAIYKADIVNQLVHTEGIASVLEIGSGDGHQAGLLWAPTYTGVEIVEALVATCNEDPNRRRSHRFVTMQEFDHRGLRADLALSLDVIYHLVEDDVFDGYMSRLFACARRFVLIYSSDVEGLPSEPHVRHRRYSDWIDRHASSWRLLKRYPQPFQRHMGSHPRHTTFASFKLFGPRSDRAD